MLKFNNNNIFTGYLKQLLASFNLPKYRVYTKEQQIYYDAYGKEKDILESILPETSIPDNLRYCLYIKDNEIQYYTCKKGIGTWHKTPYHYHENKKELNQTKNFIIKDNIYDSYTHEYLGDFLRFIRDYYNINLMPLYNCFGNRLCTNLNIDKTIQMITPDNDKESSQNAGIKKQIKFISSDQAYKIYMLPVKLFKEYTIAIDSDTSIELCCGFYDQYLDTNEKFDSFVGITHQIIHKPSFNNPFIYSKLSSKNLLSYDIKMLELAQSEPDLKLFIKVPSNNNSSIAILEGTYLNFNDLTVKEIAKENTGRKIFHNYSVPSFSGAEKLTTPLVTPLQLLALNTHVSYPFSDRLIDYLSGNVITSNDYIADNIRRAQSIIKLPHEISGVWSDQMRLDIYNNTIQKNNIGLAFDNLGYIDVYNEKNYIKNGVSISNSVLDSDGGN